MHPSLRPTPCMVSPHTGMHQHGDPTHQGTPHPHQRLHEILGDDWAKVVFKDSSVPQVFGRMPDGLLMDFNEEVTSLLGYDTQDLSQCINAKDIIYEQHHATSFDVARQLVSGQFPQYSLIKSYIPKHDPESSIPCLWNTLAVQSESVQGIASYLFPCRDFVGNKEIEDSIEYDTEFYTLVFDRSPVPMATVRAEDASIYRANESWWSLFPFVKSDEPKNFHQLLCNPQLRIALDALNVGTIRKYQDSILLHISRRKACKFSLQIKILPQKHTLAVEGKLLLCELIAE